MPGLSDAERLEALRFLRRVQARELERTERWIREAEQRPVRDGQPGPGRPAGRLTPAAPSPPVSRVPDWVLEKNITGPVGVHTGDCWVPPDNSQPLTRDQAVQAVADGAAECPACHAHTGLAVPEQSE
ncbi:DUF6233 domain-containing protein [Streptomyces sp. NBC_00690]|uniref:DUF6233 domain-containing protein n=1 Tax=Streptomyces sp. NBC_00690 TaxID=2975808 RepID=UPI002E29BBCB|nr:DUF6233 domain-containing protein [Streptomyces sp. NBC_00690]